MGDNISILLCKNWSTVKSTTYLNNQNKYLFKRHMFTKDYLLADFAEQLAQTGNIVKPCGTLHPIEPNICVYGLGKVSADLV